MPDPVDPNGLTIALASGGSITISPGPGNVGVVFDIINAPGYLAGTSSSYATLDEATSLQTLLDAVITNVTPA